MNFENKRGQLEYESSEKEEFKTESENPEKIMEKMSESSIAAGWPIFPLLNFEKEAYKKDEVYLGNKSGDEPLEMMESEYALNMIIPTDKGEQIKDKGFFADHSFSPIELYWENLSIYAIYIEKKKRCPPCSGIKKTKLLLNNMTGIARPGTFTAILGPSGIYIKIMNII